ncbi:MAG TPA: DivIVA domain-containing protein, partial [Actinomycetota bacterium]|nr:DivIVA domain-containing protein [Actinomycetota bacterium]
MRRRKAEGDPRPPGVPRITPQDIQDKEFRLSFRGYNEREVDEFLDELTEAMAELIEENRRLRERAEAGAAGPGGAEADEVLRRAREEADRILGEAREQAERIVREAGERAAALAGPVSPEERRAIGAFVKREREFLQSLAALVQGHAEAVREMARRARERAEAAEAPPAEERAPAAPPAEERPAPAPAGAGEGAPGPAAGPAER